VSDQPAPSLSLTDALALLREGDLEVRGLLPGSSNYTFLAMISNEQHQGMAVYKPRQGESPLWDFPPGTLCQRELAAFQVSEALGWNLVPATVMRVGPYGKGAVQLFVDAEFRQHYFTILENDAYRPRLHQVAAFDLIINNADRKSGHVLIDRQERIWAIDHGVCFHAQPKLRTVIWDFAGQAMSSQLLAQVAQFRADLEVNCTAYDALRPLLSDAELRALSRRSEQLLATGRFPDPDPHRRSYPWPLV
jgi:uncharacterized repeat protein (TIGR03843 family)